MQPPPDSPNRTRSTHRPPPSSGGGGGRADSWNAAAHAARTAYGRLVARLSAKGADLATAEDALSEALLSALEHWPLEGVPLQPEAWLWTAARRRFLDSRRHDRVVQAYALQEAAARLGRMEGFSPEGENTPDREDRAVDERLGLLFLCAHPRIPARDRCPLILQAFLGLKAEELAPHFLLKPATMAQRMVRAKARIRELGLHFELPDRTQWAARLDAGLDALYACYTHAWIGEGGTRGVRSALADEVRWLVHWLARRLPEEAEVVALAALLEYLEARQAAHHLDGGYVPLDEQDTGLWDLAGIDRADRGLARAAELHRTTAGALPGRFQLEAAI